MRPLLLLCALVALLRAGDSVDSVHASWQQAVDTATAAYQQGVETAGKAFGATVAKAQETCIAALVATARREGRKDERSGATAAWGEVLRLRPDHPDANAYLELLPKEQAERLRAEVSQPVTASDGLLDSGPARHPAVMADLGRLDEVEKRERAVFAKAEASCRARFTDAEGKARSRALTGLGQVAERANRAGDLSAAAAAWKAALVLHRDCVPAIAFFDKLGTTAEVLAGLPLPVDLLGPPADPAGFIQSAAANVPGAAALRGMKILVVGEAEEQAAALQAKMVERLRQAGATVTVQAHGALSEYGGERSGAVDAAVESSHLILCLRVNEVGRGGLVRLLRSGRMGVVCFDSNAFPQAGLAERIPSDGYLHGPVEPIVPITGLRHPILLGLPASLPWLLPAKPAAKPDPAAEPGIDQSAYFALNYEVYPGAVSLLGLPGRPDARIVVAYEVGMALQARGPEGPRQPGVESKLPMTTARRVAFHLFNDPKVQSDPLVVQRLSPSAWRLFDACLVWARGR